MRSSIVFRHLSVFAIVVLGVAPGCADEGAECDPLALENPCPPGDGFAQFCSAPDGNRCVNVCEGASILPGDSCEFDSNTTHPGKGCDSPLTCDNDRVAVSTCTCVLACPDVGASEGSVQAGGACSQTKDCAQNLTCDNEMVGISSCTCMAGTGGTGGTGGSGGTRGVFERCQESTMVYCNNGYNCKDTWAVEDDIFEQLYGQSLQACLDTGSCPTTEEEECPDIPGNCSVTTATTCISDAECPMDETCEGEQVITYSAANHEACISGQKTSNCEVEDIGGIISPVFPEECDEICVE